MKLTLHILLLTVCIILPNSTYHSQILADVQESMDEEPTVLTANDRQETLHFNLDKTQSAELETEDDDSNSLFENDFGLWRAGDMNSNKPLTLNNVKTILDTYLKEDPSLEKLYAEKPKRSQWNIPETNWNERIMESNNKVYLNLQKGYITNNTQGLKNPKWKLFSRRKARPPEISSSSTGDETSSGEVAKWRQEFVDEWLEKKFEALNSSRPDGDVVNMINARPWGTVCGDPDQHDLPWGSCTLADECEGEYRIYRGDYFCGRTVYVCCAILLTTYDLYQGIDVTFEHKSLSTDTEEAKKAAGENLDTPEKHKARQRRNRLMERFKRKNKLKKSLDRIIHQVKKILHKIEINGTKERKRKTRNLKRFVKAMKKKYKSDRLSIRELHLETVNLVDKALIHQLEKLVTMNDAFMRNKTFRNIVINGTITKRGARMLAEAYPALIPYLPFRRPLDKIPKNKRDLLLKLIRDNEMKNRVLEEKARRQRFRAADDEEPQKKDLVQFGTKQKKSFYLQNLQNLRKRNEATKNEPIHDSQFSENRGLVNTFYGQQFDNSPLQNLIRKYNSLENT